jgi:hypothetical protein
MPCNAPTNSDDVIDSRDVIARIEELEELETAIEDAAEFLQSCGDDEKERATELLEEAESDMDDDDRDELRALRALAEQAEGYAADWRHGETLIRDSYFEDYAQELADDIGVIPKDLGWPRSCIDWEQAARELQMDYTSVEFDGVTYWIR